jgi:hypothetical protein
MTLPAKVRKGQDRSIYFNPSFSLTLKRNIAVKKRQIDECVCKSSTIFAGEADSTIKKALLLQILTAILDPRNNPRGRHVSYRKHS